MSLDIFDIFDYDGDMPVEPLKLIPDSDPVLHQVAVPVEDPSDIGRYLPEMCRLMTMHKGVGLAAPQVGIKKRFFLINYGGIKQIYINPEVIESEAKTSSEIEGCLSYPGERRTVVRPESIKVSYTTMTGEHKTHRMRGMMARIFQHELDHLNGIVFLERAA